LFESSFGFDYYSRPYSISVGIKLYLNFVDEDFGFETLRI
jgi:hypothetical protein